MTILTWRLLRKCYVVFRILIFSCRGSSGMIYYYKRKGCGQIKVSSTRFSISRWLLIYVDSGVSKQGTTTFHHPSSHSLSLDNVPSVDLRWASTMLFKLSTRLTKTPPRLLRKTPFLTVQQFQSTRAMAMSKFNWLHPDDALAQLPPRPPHGISSNLPSNSNPTSLLSTALQNEASTDSDSEYHCIRLAVENERTLKLCLHRLSADLHWCHRERIQWPDECSLNVSTFVLLSHPLHLPD